MTFQHGTENGYANHHCRCDDCKQARAAETRRRREAKRALLPPPPTTWARFLAKVGPRGRGCWQWVGARTSSGYGNFKAPDRWYLAHRYSYTELVGPIPAGLYIDHLCHNRLCVNPAHLEPVTMAENNRRAREARACA